MRQLLAQRHLAALVCVAALLVKLLVPAGYMIDGAHGRIAITICSGTAPMPMPMPMAGPMTMAGMHGAMPDHGPTKDHGKAEMPCAFSGLSAAALGVIDPVQLAALIAFVLALGLVAASLPAPSRLPHLHPPLRGPPAYP